MNLIEPVRDFPEDLVVVWYLHRLGFEDCQIYESLERSDGRHLWLKPGHEVPQHEDAADGRDRYDTAGEFATGGN